MDICLILEIRIKKLEIRIAKLVKVILILEINLRLGIFRRFKKDVILFGSDLILVAPFRERGKPPKSIKWVY